MGGADRPSGGPVLTEKAKTITVEKIIEINCFMLEELQEFIKHFQGLADKASYDLKTIVIASQAMLDSKVAAKFNVVSEDVEGAMAANQQELGVNRAFHTTSIKMREAMEQLMGSGLVGA